MISRINEVVIDTIKKYNTEFNNININNNVVSLDNESIDLKYFNLESLFENYQLKLDLQNMNSHDLFDIIKINAFIYNNN